MRKRQPPKQIPKPPSVEEFEYIKSRTVIFDYEVKESLDLRDFVRLEILFLDYGVFLERHPEALKLHL